MDEMRSAKTKILTAARAYVDLGLPIIPLCSHDHTGLSQRHTQTCAQSGKIPIIKGWREHKETTLQQIGSWVKEFKNFNIGLPLGHVSGYVGIDVDGVVGEVILDELSGGDTPETWEYETGAGRRLLYAIPVGLKTKKSVNAGEGDHEECSILADGQQTVMPPSIHHTGKIYEWVEGKSPDDIDCALAPIWLINLVRDDSNRPNPGGRGTLDLTKPLSQVIYEKPDGGTIEVAPIIVSDTVLPAEFSEYLDLELDLTPPDTDYIGKKAKAQDADEDKVSQEEMLQKISAGGRDNQMTRIIGSFCAKFRELGKDYIMIMAKNHNLMFCDPPLDEMAIEQKVNHFWETEQMKSAGFKGVAEDGKKRFAPVVVAQAALNLLEEDGLLLKADPESDTIWITKKTEGPWRVIDAKSTQFQVYLMNAAGKEEYGGDPTWTTIRHYRDIANSLVGNLRSNGREWKTFMNSVDTQTMDGFKFIPLAGGKLLDWKTGELHAWDPETHLTYTLPVQYDPGAKAPTWEMRLKEWLPDEGSRKIVQEFIGYSLIPYMGFEQALLFQGEGANGKSLFLETIQGLLGYDVVDSVSMKTLFGRFGQASLFGKILNIVNEAGSEYLRGGNADEFKNLVSGGRIKADVKNQAHLTFNNTAKFIFSSNHDVKTGDKSEGWLRRLLIIPFEQDFSKSTVPKYEIMAPLRKESSGIFNWAIEGLRRLMAQQGFSKSEVVEKKKHAYIQQNDITADFFLNCLKTIDLSALSADGKVIRGGVPSAVVNSLFSYWLEYRESSVQKKTEHINKYLKEKHKLNKQRTTHVRFVNKTMTECWIGLDIQINDAGFLEWLLTEQPIMKFVELKQYAEKRLAEIDASNGFDGPNPPKGSEIKEFPVTQAK